MPITPEQWTLQHEVEWLRNHVLNISRRHGVPAADVCDLLIDEVCR